MPGSALASARTRARGRRSASTLRIASRTAVSSGPSVRSIGSPRQPLDLLGEKGRAALEAERRHRHAPAVVQLTHHVAERDLHVVVEDLAEVALAGEGGDGANLDAGRVHRADDPRDAAVARRLGVGAHEELLELRHVREAGPYLLPADDQEVALDSGARLEARQVGARVRLREALAPDHLAAQD